MTDETSSEDFVKLKNKDDFFECWARMVDELNIDLKLIKLLNEEWQLKDYKNCSLVDKLWITTGFIFNLYTNKTDVKYVEELKWVIKK